MLHADGEDACGETGFFLSGLMRGQIESGAADHGGEMTGLTAMTGVELAEDMRWFSVSAMKNIDSFLIKLSIQAETRRFGEMYYGGLRSVCSGWRLLRALRAVCGGFSEVPSHCKQAQPKSRMLGVSDAAGSSRGAMMATMAPLQVSEPHK